MKTVSFQQTQVVPGKIVCIGRNYVAHVHELGNEIPDEMVIFNKPNSAIADTLSATHNGDVLHYEGEIAYLFQGGRFVAAAFGLDLTKRDVQSALKAKSLPWERSKAFNGAAVFSEFVPLPEDGALLGLTLDIDGKRVQQGDTSLMMYKPEQILAEIQSFMQLNDGDVVMTGTPAGVGQVREGALFNGALVADGQPLLSHQWEAQP
ncbi:fumarylacetoacetate hydrolase family protein [Photobacterium atrarenae]|uniref:Fumarylacetoacetate hydrolase family protein n=1 Tax=Photobacterium atrarenae TaxID=865757 RepID=A0ABY5GK99_9GAMM|nr:fumarylacetoacetate hydrolase family protein [Photobacterium atrarenae]UTV29750.1 fumarylacetoacetate hydrolase family protein [Photobacterium atrarenae]